MSMETRGIRSHGTGVTGDCELPHVGTGNWPWSSARTVSVFNC